MSKGEARLQPGDAVPDAELSKLGQTGTGSIADFRGKWVLLNVWASWCDPCREESPALQRFYERHGGGDFTVLGIDSRDVSDDALEFIDEFKLTYPQLHDSEGERPDALGMTGFPESFLIDPDGNVALVRPGPVDDEYLRDEVAPMIEG